MSASHGGTGGWERGGVEVGCLSSGVGFGEVSGVGAACGRHAGEGGLGGGAGGGGVSSVAVVGLEESREGLHLRAVGEDGGEVGAAGVPAFGLVEGGGGGGVASQ